jgi:trimeric autotransporter adhesin
MSINETLAEITLVACDLSYKQNGAAGQPLTDYRDSGAVPNWYNAPAWNLTGWEVAAPAINIAATGFGAVILKNAATNEYIVALRGSDGTDPQDWYANTHVGTNQWDDNAKSRLFTALNELLTASGSAATAKIHFTGQSLGGALAQYAAYDYALSKGAQFDPIRISVTTFNALSAADGLKTLYGAGANAAANTLLAGAETAHYVTSNDIVHRLGGGNINAAGNTYLLDFPDFGQAGNVLSHAPSMLDAHRIESGFYRPFNRLGANFTSGVAHTVQYLDVTNVQQLAAAYGQLFSYRGAEAAEATMRMIAGIIFAAKNAPPAELQTLLNALMEHTSAAGDRNGWLEFLAQPGMGQILASATQGLAARTLLTSALMQGAEEHASTQGSFDSAQAQQYWNGIKPAGSIKDYVFNLVGVAPSEREALKFKISFGFSVLSGLVPGYTELSQVLVDSEKTKIIDHIFTTPNWIEAVFSDVAQKAKAIGENVGTVTVQLTKALESVLSDSVSASAAFLSELKQQVGDALAGITESIANAYDEFVAKYANPLFGWGSTNFGEVREFLRGWNGAGGGFAGAGATGTFDDVLSAALTKVEKAGQNIVIQAGAAGANPFDTANFDPTNASIAAGNLREGQVQTLTIYLPYAAAISGQRIGVRLTGASASDLKVLSFADVLVPESGVYYLTVPEGERSVSLGLWALKDSTAAGTVSLNAQLVDINKTPTHNPHDEAAVLLQVGPDLLWGPVPSIQNLPHAINQVYHHPFAVNLGLTNFNDGYWSNNYNDQVAGGAGGDFIVGTTSAFGTNDRDHFLGDSGADSLFGMDGDDVLEGGADSDVVSGDVGDDILFGDTAEGLSGLMTPGAAAGTQRDWLAGGGGQDALYGSNGNDVLLGGNDADTIVGGAGADVIFGDFDWVPWHGHWGQTPQDQDTFYYQTDWTAEGGALIDAGAQAGDARFAFRYGGAHHEIAPGGYDYTLNQWMYLSPALPFQPGNDIIYAGDGDDYVHGEAGDDFISGGAGNDVLRGGFGADRILGGAGDDELYGAGSNADADFRMLGGPDGADYLDGEDGNDWLIGSDGGDTLYGGSGVDKIIGDADDVPVAAQGDDFIDGGSGDDIIEGRHGNDRVFGGNGNDIISGDEDNDSLYGESGDDQIDGGDGDDEIFGGEGQDSIHGGAGVDKIFGGAGADGIDGKLGNDSIYGGLGDDLLIGSEGDDLLDGEEGNDTLSGDVGNDILRGGSGYDYLYGGDGDDTLDAGSGGGELRGEVGNDTYLIGVGAASVIIDDNQGMNTIKIVSDITLTSVRIGQQTNERSTLALDVGGGYSLFIKSGLLKDDQTYRFANGTVANRAELLEFAPSLDIAGSNGADKIQGGGQNDTIDAADGDDTIAGGRGNDSITGGAGADQLAGGSGDDYLKGDTGSDTYVFARGDGADVIEESDPELVDLDTLSFAAGISPNDISVVRSGLDLVLTINGSTDSIRIRYWFASSNRYHQIEQFIFSEGTIWDETAIWRKLSGQTLGTDLNDTLLGTAGDDTIDGLGGNDSIDGLGGRDSLFGSAGNDTLSGGDDNDVLDGGSGDDYLTGGAGTDTLSGADGADTLIGSDGDDSLNGGAGDDVIDGGTGFDSLSGADGMDTLLGNDGNDTLSGGEGNDTLEGGAGNDTLNGDAGSDTLVGGADTSGLDTLYGGLGSDTYAIARDGFNNYLHENQLDPNPNVDVVQFAADIRPSDVFVKRVSNTVLALRNRNTGHELWIRDFFARQDNQYKIEQFKFADGTVWDVASIKAMIDRVTEEGDFIQGYDWDDTIDGLGGNDFMLGQLGNDTLSGGLGDDTIEGGAGNDVISGGAGDDTLRGQEGNDTLDGGAGKDRLVGSPGDDVFVLGRGYGDDRVIYESSQDGSGFDMLRLAADILPNAVSLYRNGQELRVVVDASTSQLTIPSFFDATTDYKIEQIVFGNGTIWDLAAINSRVITGSANAQTGTAGNDTFVVDNIDDTITEGVDQGTDAVQSSVSYTLGANVENLTLTGVLHIDATGNALVNVIRGNASNNTLEGKGGLDTLIGGDGDDTYILDQSSYNYVTELVNGGYDTIVAPDTYTLPDNVEKLVIKSNSAFKITATGNALDNTIVGRTPQNGFLSGTNDIFDGGLGADLMISGASKGGGTFYVDNPGDRIVSGATYFADGSSSSNTDYVISSIDWTLGTNLENLQLATGATAAVTATGNQLNNQLIGNEFVNTLYGLGGQDILFSSGGADTLVGGSGNDTYFLSGVYSNGVPVGMGEVIVELAGEGEDLVQSAYDYELGANLENLVLRAYTIPNSFPTLYGYPVMGTGNSLNNRIEGNDGNNVLDGRGGDDTLTGNAGNDIYLFGPAWGSDRIAEQSASGGGIDRIKIQGSLGASEAILTRAAFDDLEVSFSTVSDKISIALQFADPAYAIEFIEFGDGTEWDGNAINARIAANNTNTTLSAAADVYVGTSSAETLDGLGGNDSISGGAGDDTLRGGVGNDRLFGNQGNDVLDGGVGNDHLRGNAGSDTYKFARGTGQDVIVEADEAGTVDTIDIATGIATSEITVAKDGQDLKLSLNGTTDEIRVSNFFFRSTSASPLGRLIEQVKFADGTIWNQATLLSMTSTIRGTAAADNLIGGDEDEQIFGLAGDDWLYGNGGNDLLDGGMGGDTMFGGQGDDIYIVDAGETPQELPNEGVDTVKSSVTYDLSLPGDDVENLELLGSAAINATGNAANNRLTGNSANNTLNGGAGADTLLGGAGDDTYVVDNVGDSITENTAEGTDSVQSSITYTLGGNAENLTLTSTGAINATGNALNNVLTGNSGNNVLDAGAGDDTLSGGAGVDTLKGGAGNDTYIVDTATDVISELANEGTDTIQSSVTLSMAGASYNNIENLTLTGTGVINATGNGLDNVLTGNSANNTLDGGAGTDTLKGGAGNDTYIIDSLTDIVAENAAEGTDTVQSSVTYSLGTTGNTNIENLTLTGTNNIDATGNALNNVLIGNVGVNTLNGGTGNDQMSGGAGNDTYVVDSTTDTVTENVNEGTDTVQSAVTFTLGANVENLTLTATTAINATGNTLDNLLTGGGGNNTLDGGAGNDTLDGGAGTDALKGGTGNDAYIVDTTTDTITENLNEGTDTVQSAVTYSLGTTANTNVENLTLTGSGNSDATGNALNNTLIGNAGVNTLNGGTGADQMKGGVGDDTYIVDNVGDVVTENANEGTDSVQSAITHTLAANVENLALTATTAINGTGNALDNVLTGGAGNNTLDGGAGNDTLNGGAGTDTLKGGAGNDLYIVDTATDILTENLNEGTDTIQSSVTLSIAAAAYNNIENVSLTAATAINATGNALDNVLTGGGGNNILDGGAGNDTLDGGAGTDTLKGGTGNDTYIVDTTTDVITENLNEGSDTIKSSATYSLAPTATANVEVLVLTGTGLINATDNALNNLLTGNSANNTLTATTGNDVLQGEAGTDTLTDTTGGNNLFNGGAGADTINASSGKELFIGGAGNDTITTGTGADLIAFNRGDGQDVVNASTGADNAISLGGGIDYASLFFRKNANDLILDVGSSEQITLKDWYLGTTNKSVVTLQMVAEAMAGFNPTGADQMRNNKIENFNFTNLVNSFDQARAATPTITSWALTNGLLNFMLAGSDTGALGGDLAYQYGKNGNLSNVSLTPAQAILGNSSFGATAQTLQPIANLQDSSPRLG